MEVKIHGYDLIKDLAYEGTQLIDSYVLSEKHGMLYLFVDCKQRCRLISIGYGPKYSVSLSIEDLNYVSGKDNDPTRVESLEISSPQPIDFHIYSNYDKYTMYFILVPADIHMDMLDKWPKICEWSNE